MVAHGTPSQRSASAFSPVPRPGTPVFRPILRPGTPLNHPVVRIPTPLGGSAHTKSTTLPPLVPPPYTRQSSLDPGLQDPLGVKAGPKTVSSYHTSMPTHNQAGKFHKVAPPQNFWGASNAAWKRRVCQGNPPILPLAIPGTPAPQAQPSQPPDPSPFWPPGTTPQAFPRRTGGPPDVGGPGGGGSPGGDGSPPPGSPGGAGSYPHGSPGSSCSSSQRRSRQIPKARTPLGDRIHWDGQLSTFMVYKQAITGHLLMTGAGYLVNPAFHASYLQYREEGLDYFDSQDFHLSYPDITPAQARLDRGYFFGMLMSSNKNGERKFLLKYSTTHDGIFTWIEFLRDYDNNGDSEIRAEQLDSLIHVPYSSKSPGGFLKYIDTLQAYLNELDTLTPGVCTDTQKTKLLYRNLQGHPSMSYLLQTCRDHEYDFHTACIYLRTCSVQN